jgi:hypothetical protein
MKNLLVVLLPFLFFAHSVFAIDGLKAYGTPKERDDLVRFAIIADLSGGEREGIFKVAGKGIDAMQPDFILAVGDFIEGGTEDIDVLNEEWSTFKANLGNENLIFFPAVGNHDISNSVMREWYEKTIGPRYYHFRYKNILFLIVDTEDFSDDFFSHMKKARNEAIAIYKTNPEDFPSTEYAKMPERIYGVMRPEQTEYFLDAINENKDVTWTFIIVHKLIWKDDNDKEFKKLEAALSGSNYTVFNGHVHTYEHTKRLDNDYIQLATSGGEQFEDMQNNMDHIMWVSVDKDGPKYLNIKLDGMRDKEGNIPAGGNDLCFEVHNCEK